MGNDEEIKLGFFKKIKLVFCIAILAILVFFEDIFRYQREDEEEEFYDGLSRDQKHEEDF